MARHAMVTFSLLLCLTAVAGCATAGGNADDDDDVGDQGGPDSGVVIVPDGGGPGTPDAAPVSCDLVAQTGCPGGMACDLDDMGLPTCRAITSPGGVTSTCADNSACGSGFPCISGRAQSSCLEFWNTDHDRPRTGPLCVSPLLARNQNPIPGAKMCTQACNPVDSTGCPATWGCHIYKENAGAMRFLTACDPGGASGQEQACTDNASCQPNYMCLCTNSPTCTVNQCFETCNATDNLGCTAGLTCSGFTPSVIVGNKAYGYCS